MSYDPTTGQPIRPRSTPIPDGSAFAAPPPTAEEFLREAGNAPAQPSTAFPTPTFPTPTFPQPGAPDPGSGQQGQAGFGGQPGFQPGFQGGFQPGFQGGFQPGFQQGFGQGGFEPGGIPSQGLPYVTPPGGNQWGGAQFGGAQFGGVPFVGPRSSGLRGFRIGMSLFITIVTLGIVGFAIWKTNDTVKKATAPFNQPVHIPPFTVPDISIPAFTIPNVTVPVSVPVIPGVSVPTATVPADSVVVAPTTIDPAATTVPAVTVPPTPTTLIPGGASSFFEGNAARTVMDQFEANFAGSPTHYDEVDLFPDHAIAFAQDPANPGQLTGAEWSNGQLSPGTVTTDPRDFTAELFTKADVNWDAVAGLVPTAPTLLGITDGKVSHIIVQRTPFDPANPLSFAVYVEGASANGYVLAGADGTVLSTHKG